MEYFWSCPEQEKLDWFCCNADQCPGHCNATLWGSSLGQWGHALKGDCGTPVSCFFMSIIINETTISPMKDGPGRWAVSCTLKSVLLQELGFKSSEVFLPCSSLFTSTTRNSALQLWIQGSPWPSSGIRGFPICLFSHFTPTSSQIYSSARGLGATDVSVKSQRLQVGQDFSTNFCRSLGLPKQKQIGYLHITEYSSTIKKNIV